MKLKTIWAVAAILFVISTVAHAKSHVKTMKRCSGHNIQYEEKNVGTKNLKIFEPYRKIFELYAQTRGVYVDLSGVNIAFEDITCPNKSKEKFCIVGLCHTDPSDEDLHDITIDRRTWKYNSYLSREQLMMHELGHCVLGREHTDAVNAKDKRPASIMTPDMISDEIYKKFQKDYIDELFNTDDESLENDLDCSTH